MLNRIIAGRPKDRRHAVDFDGSNDYYYRSSALATAANIWAGSYINFWIEIDAAPASTETIFDIYGSALCYLQLNTSRQLVWRASSSGGGNYITTTSNALATGVMHNVQIQGLYGAGYNTGLIYVDDVDATASDVHAGGNIAYDNLGSPISLGSAWNGSSYANHFDGCIAEFWYDAFGSVGATPDITSTATRRKFLTATGAAADLGSDGSTPTGSPPDIYFSRRGLVTTFDTNRGNGGSFSKAGAVTKCTSPLKV